MTEYSNWTAPSANVQYNVHLGTWTNWSRGGRILGATLTLESRYGRLLLSFTATFVGFVASKFWRILTLILHRIYSTPEPRDALHHQRQVVLRNSLSAASTLWTSLQLVWCWRAIADGHLARILPIIISAASAFCAFTIAGGFTSSISTGIGNDVLIDGSQCGVVTDGALTMETLSTVYPLASQSMNNVANYAQQCYSLNSTGILDCATFVKSRLEFKSVLNASCPFSNDICRSNVANLLLDSGLISSDDFGMNLPSDQRMFHREVLHCAPLRTDGFVSNVSMKYNNYTRYSYGSFEGFKNWTYQAEDLDEKYGRQTDNLLRSKTTGFNLIAMASRVANGTFWSNSDFVPIPQLAVSDADLTLIFLSPEGVYFLNQTNDPWYRGTVPNEPFHLPFGQHTTFIPDEAASPMACLQRYQYCNSRNRCGSLASRVDALVSASTLFHGSSDDIWSTAESNSRPEMSRLEMFHAMIHSFGGLQNLINTLGPSSLLSSQHFNMGLMGPLPDNQWQLDASHWFSILLATLQTNFVNTARGPTDQVYLPYVMKPDVYQRVMCNNQKILSTDYTSLSLFGLCLTYATGIIIILASYVAEPLLAFFYSRRKYEEYKYLEWATNGTLQLQRLAYQGLGSEKWSNYTDDIPKTRPGYFLADLARAYPPGDGDDEIQGMKPTVYATSTTAPSVSEASANLHIPGQPGADPSRPVSAVSELIPQVVSMQAVTPHAVSPVSQQAVSPISQHPEG